MTRPIPIGRRGVPAATVIVVLALVACESPLGGPPAPDCPTGPPTASQADAIVGDVSGVTVVTSLGSFTMTLYGEAAPIASANFVNLARCGFYEGITFHRVLAGFVAQAGDPNTRANQGDFQGLGTGNPGYTFAIELPPEALSYDPYVVAMANNGLADSNGSQFFICLAGLDERLPNRTFTIFGLVTDGTAVVDAIGSVEVNDPLIGVPVDPVVIERIEVIGPQSTPG